MKRGEETERCLNQPEQSLVRLVSWAHTLLREVLVEGDLAIDLTAGRGRDTLFLFRRVGASGRVLAFDIQEAALKATAALLWEAGAQVEYRHAAACMPLAPGVHLVPDSHAALELYLNQAAPRGVIANLGYLPGGDRTITTKGPTTLAALELACRRLLPGGRIAVTVYSEQTGGREEGEAVGQLFALLPPRDWEVLRFEIPNRAGSPFLLVAAKRRD